MKLWAIFRYEFNYQLRSVSTWIYCAITFLFPIILSRIGKPTDDTYANSPSWLIFVTVFGGILWLLMAGAIAGSAAARDVQTRMHPLTYTAPVRKIDYLGGRFLAAFALNALLLLAIPVGFLLAFLVPGIEAALLGPFRPAAYLTTYFYLALPVAFVATACQFSVAALDRRAIAGFIVSILLFPIISQFVGTTVASLAKNWELARLIDLVGISIMASMETWTPFEKNTRLIKLGGIFLWNRLLWLGIALGFLTYAYFRFQFTHSVATTWWSNLKRKRNASSPTPAVGEFVDISAISIPQARPTFGFATHVRQTQAIAWSSFRMIAKSRAGLTIVGVFALHLVVFGHEYLKLRGVPQFATTLNLLTRLTASLGDLKTPLIIIPILIVFYAGELVWREREAGLSKISDSVPVSEWVLFLGKFLGISLVIIVWLGFLMLSGLLTQVSMGYTDFEVGLYLQALFGLQLIDYLLFALLALVVHVVVNQKYLGHLAVLIIYLIIAFAAKLGIEHHLLLYASDSGWAYSDMRGFEPHLGPWLWFKLYWTAWALLLAVAARLLWVRTMTQSLKMRLQLARQRFTHPTAWAAAVALGGIFISGGYIFYNTNVLNEYTSAADRAERDVRYELNYRKYKDSPQPRLAGTKLHIELYPSQRRAAIRATYHLVNSSKVPIDSIHLSTKSGVETKAIAFDRSAAPVLENKELGYRMFALEKTLLPGDSLNLSFEVHFNAQGFGNKGIDASITANGSYFINYDWLPAIGYQQNRELSQPADRRKYGLAPRGIPSLYASAANQSTAGKELITFEAVVGTEAGQTAISPGALRRRWTQNGRNYFQYATSAPIRNTYSFFSARYATRQVTWNHVAIRLYYHPGHAEHTDRILQSVQASLSYFTTKFGPYPYRHLTIIERSGYAGELNAEPTTIDYGEPFILSNLRDNPGSLDIVYFALAHEVAHQWWGAAQLIPAYVEGGMLLSETLANYSGLQVMEETHGNEQVRQLLNMWRDSYEVPRARAAAPLLRATDPFLGYRKGPLALYALTQYIGKERVNDALRQLLAKHGSGKPPLPTSLDLYRELKAVTPDSLQYLLRDYFEKNIYWQLKTVQATARQNKAGTWQVTLSMQAQKAVVDSTGAENPVPMNDWVEVGIFASGEEKSGKPLYLRKHRLRSGQQTITVTVSEKPARAGLDPNYLLIDLDLEDNTRKVKVAGTAEDSPSLI